MSSKGPNFNWVKAYLDCSLSNEYLELVSQAKKIVTIRNASLTPDDGFTFLTMEPEKGKFTVSRKPLEGVLGERSDVSFHLRNDHICIAQSELKPFMLRLTLDEDGDCRYSIDGKGAYQRWQVLRTALQYIFFDSVPPGVRAPGDYGITI